MAIKRPRLSDQEKQQRMSAKVPGSVWISESGAFLTIARIFSDEFGIERAEWAETGSCPVWHTIWGHRANTPYSVGGVVLPPIDVSTFTYTIRHAEESGEYEIDDRDDLDREIDAILKTKRAIRDRRAEIQAMERIVADREADLIEGSRRTAAADAKRVEEARANRDAARELIRGTTNFREAQDARALLVEATAEVAEAEENLIASHADLKKVLARYEAASIRVLDAVG